MNANERNEIVKLIQPNILPNAVEIEVKVTEEQVFEQVLPNEVIDYVVDELVNLDIISDDDDEYGEVETDYDFSALNKLELIDILEETVQDADVVKIKDKVVAIKSIFLRICKVE